MEVQGGGGIVEEGWGREGYYSDKERPFHACTSVIPVVYFPVKVISAAKYRRDQSISLTTVPREARGPRGYGEKRGGVGGVLQVNSKQRRELEEGFD